MLEMLTGFEGCLGLLDPRSTRLYTTFNQDHYNQKRPNKFAHAVFTQGFFLISSHLSRLILHPILLVYDNNLLTPLICLSFLTDYTQMLLHDRTNRQQGKTETGDKTTSSLSPS